MGFNDVGSGFQIVAGHPAEDLPCVQALYTPALSRDSEGDPAPFGVEVPGQYVLSDGMWSHVLVDRNLSVSGDADPYHFNVTFTMLWGYRNAAVQEGVCQDLGVADQTTEYAHFALDLSDPDNAYANPARRQKHFSQGERRCTRLSAASIYGTPIHGEGVLSGERHQAMRNVILLVGADSSPTSGDFGLDSGRTAPIYDAQNGYVLGGEGGNGACQSSLRALHATWAGFSDDVGGIAMYRVTIVTRDGTILVNSLNVKLYTTYEIPAPLRRNTTVQLQVTAVNHAGLTTTIPSAWIRILNNGLPMDATILNGPDDGGTTSTFQSSPLLGNVLYWGHSSQFSAHWYGYLREDKDLLNITQGRNEWTARDYEYSIGFNGNTTYALTWTQTSGTSVTMTGLRLEDNTHYYVTVRTTNCAGVLSVQASAPFLVDLSAPIAGLVFDGNVSVLTDRHVMRPYDPIFASWAFFRDTVSGLHHYEWAAGSTQNASLTNVRSWENVGLATSVDTTTAHANSSVPDMRGLGMSLGDTLYVFVRAYDNVGRYVTVISNGSLLINY